MRSSGLLTLIALTGLMIAAAVWLTLSLPAKRGLNLGDMPASEMIADEHGNWMCYFLDRGKLRWLVIAHAVPTPDLPSADDARTPAAKYHELSVGGKAYAMSGGRNFYTMSSKTGLTPAAHLVLAPNFVKLINRLHRDRDAQGTEFNIIATTKDFFEKNAEIVEMMKALETE